MPLSEQLTQLLNNMKRILFSLSFIVLLVSGALFSGSVFAQQAPQCDGIISEDAQFSQCCKGGNDEPFACATWRMYVRANTSRCRGSIADDTTYALCCEGASGGGVGVVDVSACLNYGAKKNQVSCTNIDTELEYHTCCGPLAQNPPREQCDSYIALSTIPTSGTQSTNPVGGTQNEVTLPNNGSAGATGAGIGACSAIKFKSLLDILIWAKCVITGAIIPLIFALATIFFLWNVAVFIRSADKTSVKEEARQRMVWGIVALFIMISVWGIISIMSNIFGISPSVPLLQTKTYLDPAKASK